MPFVSDIAGPQNPVPTWPAPCPGGVRRTSTIDTHPDGPGSAVAELRARDVLVSASGAVNALDDVVVHARLTERVIDDISGDDSRLEQLRGCRVGPGFRATVTALLGSDVERSTLLHLLLDDWVGATLVSGYGIQHTAIVTGTEEPMPADTADRMSGICSGFAPDASLIDFTRRNLIVPCVHGPVAPVLIDGADGAMHPLEPLRPHGMRRMRRLDLCPEGSEASFDVHFRDTHVDGPGIETIVHEYTVTGVIDVPTRTVVHVDAAARVLPWQECPGALGSAARVVGMTLGQLRNRVRTEFVGTSTCTHLNDTLRSLGDLGALLDLHERPASATAR
jgi:hypothetical protein